jgi:hypothetical protein
MSIRNPNSKFNLINNRIKYGTDGGINVDAGTLFVDASNSRVGIGTNSPASPLDVSGSVNISGNLVVNGSPVSGPSYTFSREYTFITQDGSLPVYNDLTPIAFVEYKYDATFNYDVDNTRNINLLTNGGVAFLCPTTLSNITGSINFGFRDYLANDISLNIYKTSITNAYTDFSTGATLLYSSRFVYNTPVSVANITVPVNVTTAGLTNNDIVYVAFEMDPPTPGPVLIFTMRYTLNFS